MAGRPWPPLLSRELGRQRRILIGDMQQRASKTMNWTRGLRRLYILVVIGWLLYWFVWIPLEGVRTWEQLAQASLDDPEKFREYIAHANLVAQWRELGQEIARAPLVSLLFLVIPPLAGYGLLRLTLFTIRWIAGGFRADGSGQSDRF